MAIQKYDVIRRHFGDKMYEEGDRREANETDVKHLIGKSLVKRAEKPKNKAAKTVKNKSA